MGTMLESFEITKPVEEIRTFKRSDPMAILIEVFVVQEDGSLCVKRHVRIRRAPGSFAVVHLPDLRISKD